LSIQMLRTLIKILRMMAHQPRFLREWKGKVWKGIRSQISHHPRRIFLRFRQIERSTKSMKLIEMIESAIANRAPIGPTTMEGLNHKHLLDQNHLTNKE